MRAARIFSRRCNLGGTGTKVNNNSRSTCPRTTTSSFAATGGTPKSTPFRFESRSNHCRPIGSCASSLSTGRSLSLLCLTEPSAVTASSLEYEEEDIDGTWVPIVAMQTYETFGWSNMKIDELVSWGMVTLRRLTDPRYDTVSWFSNLLVDTYKQTHTHNVCIDDEKIEIVANIVQ